MIKRIQMMMLYWGIIKTLIDMYNANVISDWRYIHAQRLFQARQRDYRSLSLKQIGQLGDGLAKLSLFENGIFNRSFRLDIRLLSEITPYEWDKGNNDDQLQ